MRNTDSTLRTTTYILILALSISLPACGTDTSAEPTPVDESALTTEPTSKPVVVETQVAAAEPVCGDCGTISNIDKRTEKGKAKGGGAVAGAVLGALVGREVVKGDRDKRNLAGAAAAIGGGYAGHKIEEKARSETYYVVSVRMDDGRTESVTLNSTENLGIGQRVYVRDGNIILR